jgi:hypothetical protein
MAHSNKHHTPALLLIATPYTECVHNLNIIQTKSCGMTMNSNVPQHTLLVAVSNQFCTTTGVEKLISEGDARWVFIFPAMMMENCYFSKEVINVSLSRLKFD